LDKVGEKIEPILHDKYCKKCNESKPLAGYYYNFDKQKSRWRYSKYCRECSEIVRNKNRDRKKQLEQTIQTLSIKLPSPLVLAAALKIQGKDVNSHNISTLKNNLANRLLSV